MREIESGAPFECLRLYGDGIDGYLHALIADVAHVGSHQSVRIAVGRHRIVVYKVACALVVVFDGTREAVVEHAEVQSDIEHSRAFPLKVGVGVAECSQRVLLRGLTVGVGVREPS